MSLIVVEDPIFGRDKLTVLRQKLEREDSGTLPVYDDTSDPDTEAQSKDQTPQTYTAEATARGNLSTQRHPANGGVWDFAPAPQGGEHSRNPPRDHAQACEQGGQMKGHDPSWPSVASRTIPCHPESAHSGVREDPHPQSKGGVERPGKVAPQSQGGVEGPGKAVPEYGQAKGQAQFPYPGLFPGCARDASSPPFDPDGLGTPQELTKPQDTPDLQCGRDHKLELDPLEGPTLSPQGLKLLGMDPEQVQSKHSHALEGRCASSPYCTQLRGVTSRPDTHDPSNSSGAGLPDRLSIGPGRLDPEPRDNEIQHGRIGHTADTAPPALLPSCGKPHHPMPLEGLKGSEPADATPPHSSCSCVDAPTHAGEASVIEPHAEWNAAGCARRVATGANLLPLMGAGGLHRRSTESLFPQSSLHAISVPASQAWSPKEEAHSHGLCPKLPGLEGRRETPRIGSEDGRELTQLAALGSDPREHTIPRVVGSRLPLEQLSVPADPRDLIVLQATGQTSQGVPHMHNTPYRSGPPTALRAPNGLPIISTYLTFRECPYAAREKEDWDLFGEAIRDTPAIADALPLSRLPTAPPRVPGPAEVIELREPLPAEVLAPREPLQAEVIEPREPLSEWVQEPRAPLSERVKEPREPLSEWVQEPRAPLSEWVKEPREPLSEWVKEPREPLSEWVKEPREPLSEWVQEPREPLSERVQEQRELLSERVQEPREPLLGRVSSSWPPSLQPSFPHHGKLSSRKPIPPSGSGEDPPSWHGSAASTALGGSALGGVAWREGASPPRKEPPHPAPGPESTPSSLVLARVHGRSPLRWVEDPKAGPVMHSVARQPRLLAPLSHHGVSTELVPRDPTATPQQLDPQGQQPLSESRTAVPSMEEVPLQLTRPSSLKPSMLLVPLALLAFPARSPLPMAAPLTQGRDPALSLVSKAGSVQSGSPTLFEAALLPKESPWGLEISHWPTGARCHSRLTVRRDSRVEAQYLVVVALSCTKEPAEPLHHQTLLELGAFPCEGGHPTLPWAEVRDPSALARPLLSGPSWQVSQPALEYPPSLSAHQQDGGQLSPLLRPPAARCLLSLTPSGAGPFRGWPPSPLPPFSGAALALSPREETLQQPSRPSTSPHPSGALRYDGGAEAMDPPPPPQTPLWVEAEARSLGLQTLVVDHLDPLADRPYSSLPWWMAAWMERSPAQQLDSDPGASVIRAGHLVIDCASPRPPGVLDADWPSPPPASFNPLSAGVQWGSNVATAQHRPNTQQRKAVASLGIETTPYTQHYRSTRRTLDAEDTGPVLGVSLTMGPQAHKDSSSLPMRIKLLQVQVRGRTVDALLDTGSTTNLISTDAADELQLTTYPCEAPYRLKVGNGDYLCIQREVLDLSCKSGALRFRLRAGICALDFPMVLGIPFFEQEDLTWKFRKGHVCTWRGGRECPLQMTLPVGGPAGPADPTMALSPTVEIPRKRAMEAHSKLLQKIQRDGPKAAALVRLQPKRHKNFRTAHARALVKQIIAEAREARAQAQKTEEQQLFAVILAVNNVTNLRKIQKQRLNTDGDGAQGAQLAPPDHPGGGGTHAHSDASQPATVPPQSTFLSVPRSISFRIRDEFKAKFTKLDSILEDTLDPVDLDLPPLLEDYRSLFGDELPPGLPMRRIIDHTIPLVPGQLPPKGSVYPMETKVRLAQKEILQGLADGGLITHTSSPYGAPTLMVEKKPERPGMPPKYRMVVNYQELNKITVAAESPIPNIQRIMEQLGGAQWFTLLDMDSGFQQVRMAPEDQHKTAFRTSYGQFEYKVMPQGLKGAPGTFQTIMSHILFQHLDLCCVVYLDDVLIYSPTKEQHLKDVRVILECLKQAQMYPKISKCRFLKQRLDYLGHSLGATGIRPSADKLETISVWPETLHTVTEVMQFLGTVGYVRMFMGPRFADMAQPLVALTKKGAPFVWTPAHTAAVRQLKERLVSYTLLQMPDPSRPYQLYTDASGYALGAVLEQDGKPLGFLSKKMNPAQQKYSTYNQELLALLTALKRWEYLLRAADVTAFTDHQSLQHLGNIKAACPHRGMQARWVDQLGEYPNLKFQYTPGKTNIVADALSRNPLHAEPAHSVPRMLQLQEVEPHLPFKGATAVRLTCGEETHPQGLPKIAQCYLKMPSLPLPSTASPHMEAPDTHPTPSVLRESAPEVRSPNSLEVASRIWCTSIDATPQDSQSYLRITRHPLLDQEAVSPPAVIGTPEWNTATEACPRLGPILATARANPLTPVEIPADAEGHARRRRYRLATGILQVHAFGGWRYAVPTSDDIRLNLLYQFHDHALAGHVGFNKTYHALSMIYFWEGMLDYVKNYVDTCLRCQASKAVSHKPAGLLQNLQIPTRRWAHVSMDFITGLPLTANGNDGILVVVDLLSKMSHFVPLPGTTDAAGVADLFMQHVVRLHGVPEKLVSDRDSRFVADFWKSLMKRCDIQRALSTAWHPQTDGQTERTNRTLEGFLRVFLQADKAQWETLLPAIELAYNCTPHASSGRSPFETMIGENPPTGKAHEFLAHHITPPLTRTFRTLVARAIHHIQRAQARQKRNADDHRCDLTYAVGDQVWLSTVHLQLDGPRKLQDRYIGPYSIQERIGRVAYRLDLPPSLDVHPVFHVSLLRPHKADTLNRPAIAWGPTYVDGEEQYEVEAILDVTGDSRNRRYLIHWKGYPREGATWEKEANLAGCKAKLKAFWRTFNRGGNPRPGRKGNGRPDQQRD